MSLSTACLLLMACSALVKASFITKDMCSCDQFCTSVAPNNAICKKDCKFGEKDTVYIRKDARGVYKAYRFTIPLRGFRLPCIV
ncbi:unnamed protein product [Cylicocyclus nassatus]|uniref:Uncharacterized protein n=1 Tax=Cylicocyclus nassatus TaxID=53992 RepID=A0AA36DW72_CYLNA|nr:unnamed protein product [Cylicocyclus nassatus]